MLISFTVDNFSSFGGKGAVSFERSRTVDGRRKGYVDVEGHVLSKAIAVIGPNASGKTNLLKALSFLIWFMSDSFSGLKPEEAIPTMPCFFRKRRLTTFEIEFLIGDKYYIYLLCLDERQVLKEELYVRAPGRAKLYIFKKNTTSNTTEIVSSPKFDFPLKKFSHIRPNVSIISTALQHDNKLAVDIYKNFLLKIDTGFDHLGLPSQSGSNKAAEFFYKNQEARQLMTNIIKNVDLGINNIEVDKKEPIVSDLSFEKSDTESLNSPFIPESLRLGLTSERYKWYGVHKTKDERKFKLPSFMESGGTNKLFCLLSRLIPVLLNGGLVIIDEIDSEIHPDILEYLLDLFLSEKNNPHCAQILFTTHCREVLDFLEKYQVLLVEKNDLVSSVWRLDEVTGIRSEDNLYKKYRAGAYGAAPNLYPPDN